MGEEVVVKKQMADDYRPYSSDATKAKLALCR